MTAEEGSVVADLGAVAEEAKGEVDSAAAAREEAG